MTSARQLARETWHELEHRIRKADRRLITKLPGPATPAALCTLFCKEGDAIAGRQLAQGGQGTCWFTGRPTGAKLSHWAQANSGRRSSRAPAACASAIRASTPATQAARVVAGGCPGWQTALYRALGPPAQLAT